MKDDRVFPLHMRDAARQCLEYARGHNRAELDDNPLLVDGLVRQLTIIGEAARRVGPETRVRAAAIPWAEVVGMGNLVVHEYFSVDPDVVWTTVETDLPDLLARLGPILGDE